MRQKTDHIVFVDSQAFLTGMYGLKLEHGSLSQPYEFIIYYDEVLEEGEEKEEKVEEDYFGVVIKEKEKVRSIFISKRRVDMILTFMKKNKIPFKLECRTEELNMRITKPGYPHIRIIDDLRESTLSEYGPEVGIGTINFPSPFPFSY